MSLEKQIEDAVRQSIESKTALHNQAMSPELWAALEDDRNAVFQVARRVIIRLTHTGGVIDVHQLQGCYFTLGIQVKAGSLVITLAFGKDGKFKRHA